MFRLNESTAATREAWIYCLLVKARTFFFFFFSTLLIRPLGDKHGVKGRTVQDLQFIADNMRCYKVKGADLLRISKLMEACSTTDTSIPMRASALPRRSARVLCSTNCIGAERIAICDGKFGGFFFSTQALFSSLVGRHSALP
jgi:hypothetical protein